MEPAVAVSVIVELPVGVEFEEVEVVLPWPQPIAAEVSKSAVPR